MKDIVNKLIIIFIFLLNGLTDISAQDLSENRAIQWISDSIKLNQYTGLITSNEFPRFSLDRFGNLPSVYLKIPVISSNYTVSINLNKTSSAFLAANNEDEEKIKSDIQLTYHTVYENKKPFLLVSFLPLFKDQQGLKKVDEYSLQINAVKEFGSPIKNLSTHLPNSVLASGNWYKIAVKNEGIYKITYDFLRNLGIDVNSINPKNIRVYGNGGAMLPQNNAQKRIDDLQENAIQVFGEADNKLDNTDYVLFYAQGNTKWSLNSNSTYFQHQNNIYTDSSYYFINVDKGTGKRISVVSAGAQTPNYTSNEYDDYQLYEKDLYTLVTSSIKSGRNWYGEDFEFNAARNFDFNITGIQSNAPLFLKTNMLIRANVNSNASV